MDKKIHKWFSVILNARVAHHASYGRTDPREEEARKQLDAALEHPTHPSIPKEVRSFFDYVIEYLFEWQHDRYLKHGGPSARAWLAKCPKATEPWQEWTQAELTSACRNVGVDITCGRCAMAFFTGTNLGEQHDANCASSIRENPEARDKATCPKCGATFAEWERNTKHVRCGICREWFPVQVVVISLTSELKVTP